MAKQKGIIPLKGTIGNITFYKTKDGYLAREKGGVDAQRIATDPAFQRTRENGAEFGAAGKAARLVRISVRGLTLNASDGKMVGRFTQRMLKVIQADPVNPRGQRNVTNGDVQLIEGFEFNINGKLSTTFFAPVTLTIDRIAGTLVADIPPFIAAELVAAPVGATHFKINSAGTAIDFTGNTYALDTQSTGELMLDGGLTKAITLTNTIGANSVFPLFLFLGIEFFQEVNGVMYSLKNGAFNALSISKISKNP